MSALEKNVEAIIKALGGKENIKAVSNCMTRLRTVVKDEAPVNETALKELDFVLGLVHDRENAYEIVVGPGKSKKYADCCIEYGIAAGTGGTDDAADSGWKQNKARLKANQKNSRVKEYLKVVGDIFIPLIPGVIAAGLCAGLASLVSQLVPGYADSKVWNFIYQLLSLINSAFTTYITAWAGYRAAERFGGTPILGGMLGMITSLDGINAVSRIFGLYNEAAPLESILRVGKGGVLAVIAGVLFMCFIEKKIRKHMPDNLDIIFTPFITLIVCVIPYIVIIMPLFGYVSSAIVWVFSKACMSESIIVRVITGFVSAALFLPLVAAGMHHGMVALYSVQLQELGFITLYPALAMAGAGQVGAAIAIWKKAKNVGNKRVSSVAAGAIPAGFLGIGEPLIYGVTLPLGRPFITAGLGAGFGGAFVMAFQVASTTWGPSGLLGVFVMTAGPNGALKSALIYLIGLVISYVCSFIITNVFFDEKELAVGGNEKDTAEKPAAAVPEETGGKFVHHGDIISFSDGFTEFEYEITDETGIHARPAGELVKLIRQFDCNVTVGANGKTASAGSLIELMNLGAVKGTKCTVKAEGTDAVKAARAARNFFTERL